MMKEVDLRVVMQDMPPQDVVTRDNVSVKVDAAFDFRILETEEPLSSALR